MWLVGWINCLILGSTSTAIFFKKVEPKTPESDQKPLVRDKDSDEQSSASAPRDKEYETYQEMGSDQVNIRLNK